MSRPEPHAAFARALLDPAAGLPPGIARQAGAGAQARFAVYRNNVIVGLVDALRARFPVTAALVGEEFFAALAREFARAQPPTDPVLMRYGEALPAFIEGFVPAADLPYLADVARVEVLWSQSWAAAEAVALAPAVLAALDAEALLAACAVLHPATRLLRSAHPAASLWSAHQGAGPAEPPAHWAPEDLLITRPEAEVQLYRLPPGGYACIAALAAAEPLQSAFAAGLAEADDLNPGALLGLLLEAGALAALNPESR